MPLRERVFKCQKCSFEIDRDLNASINLENAPDEKVTVSIGRATPESNACGQEGADTLGRNRKKTSKKSRIG
jgi:transposase